MVLEMHIHNKYHKSSKGNQASRTILLRQSDGFNAVLPIILSDREKSIMDKIRMSIDTLQSQENNLLSIEALRLQVDSRTIIDTILTAILIASVITGVSIFVINRHMHGHRLNVQRSLQVEVKKGQKSCRMRTMPTA